MARRGGGSATFRLLMIVLGSLALLNLVASASTVEDRGAEGQWKLPYSANGGAAQNNFIAREALEFSHGDGDRHNFITSKEIVATDVNDVNHHVTPKVGHNVFTSVYSTTHADEGTADTSEDEFGHPGDKVELDTTKMNVRHNLVPSVGDVTKVAAVRRTVTTNVNGVHHKVTTFDIARSNVMGNLKRVAKNVITLVNEAHTKGGDVPKTSSFLGDRCTHRYCIIQ